MTDEYIWEDLDFRPDATGYTAVYTNADGSLTLFPVIGWLIQVETRCATGPFESDRDPTPLTERSRRIVAAMVSSDGDIVACADVNDFKEIKPPPTGKPRTVWPRSAVEQSPRTGMST